MYDLAGNCIIGFFGGNNTNLLFSCSLLILTIFDHLSKHRCQKLYNEFLQRRGTNTNHNLQGRRENGDIMFAYHSQVFMPR